MKTKYKIIIAIIVIIPVLWLTAYKIHKNTSNLPPLSQIAEMDEAQINELLTGYKKQQLAEIWGEPDPEKSIENQWIYVLSDDLWLEVNSNNKHKVVICGLHSVFKAKIIECNDGYFLVEPAETSKESKSSDRIEVPCKNMDAALEPQKGDIIEIVHSGDILETYPARLVNVIKINLIEENKTIDLVLNRYVSDGSYAMQPIDLYVQPETWFNDRVLKVEDEISNIIEETVYEYYLHEISQNYEQRLNCVGIDENYRMIVGNEKKLIDEGIWIKERILHSVKVLSAKEVLSAQEFVLNDIAQKITDFNLEEIAVVEIDTTWSHNDEDFHPQIDDGRYFRYLLMGRLPEHTEFKHYEMFWQLQ